MLIFVRLDRCGGTSAAAPLWAAATTDTNEYLADQGKSALRNVNAKLYSLFNTTQTYTAYHDITTGSNLYYSATTGYNVASGIGSPDVWNLAPSPPEREGRVRAQLRQLRRANRR